MKKALIFEAGTETVGDLTCNASI